MLKILESSMEGYIVNIFKCDHYIVGYGIGDAELRKKIIRGSLHRWMMLVGRAKEYDQQSSVSWDSQLQHIVEQNSRQEKKTKIQL